VDKKRMTEDEDATRRLGDALQGYRERQMHLELVELCKIKEPWLLHEEVR
jgi:hypothetical protein